MARQRYNYGDGAPTATYPSGVMSVEEARDWGTSATVTDETISISSTGLMELDYVPQGDLQIWTGTSKSGTQFTIVEGTPAVAYEVKVNYANGYLTFYSSEYSTTAYATYTASCSCITKRAWDKLQREVQAVQQSNSALQVRLNKGLAKGALVRPVAFDGSYPVVTDCLATSGYTMPICIGALSTSGTLGTVVAALALGVLGHGASSFPAGVQLAVGTDGKAAWPGKSTYPAAGDTFQAIGVGLGATSYLVNISPIVGRL